MKTKKQFFYNALLLTAVALLMRTVGVSFNVYVSNRVGGEAMGLLALIASVYGFATTLATSGIHLATVRTVAQRLEESGGRDNRRCLAACLSYATFFGLLASILLFSLALPIGRFAIGDARTVRPLRMLALTLLPIALTTVLNGYFTAVRRAWKNAAAQVSEQAVKILFTTYLLVIVSPKSPEGCVMAILLGGAVSESLSLLFNIILYKLDKRHFAHVEQRPLGRRIRVEKIALPIAVSAYIRSGLLAIEHILIPKGLIAFGEGSAAALSSYGTLHSMALPVVLYPAAILTSFAALLIPEVTEQQSIGNKREIRYIAGRVYQFTLLFAIGTAGIMLFFSGALGEALYKNAEVSLYIRYLAPLVPVMYLDTATDALLKGLGEQVYSMNVNILDAFVSVVAVWILVPRFGILGYVVTIYITECLNATLSILRMLLVSGYRPALKKLIVSPILAVLGAGAIARLLFGLLPPFGTVISILITALLYLFLLIGTGGIAPHDIRWGLKSIVPERRVREKEKLQNCNSFARNA